MIYWAAVFLIIALVAAVLGFSGIAGTAVNIAWILFVVGLIVAVIFFALGRRSPPLERTGAGRQSASSPPSARPMSRPGVCTLRAPAGYVGPTRRCSSSYTL